MPGWKWLILTVVQKNATRTFMASGVVGAAVKDELGMLDTAFDTVFTFHGDDKAFLVTDPTVVVIIGRECKLGKILVSLC